MFNRIYGVTGTVYEEGTHVRVPWFDTPYMYDIKIRPHNIQSLTGSRGKCGAYRIRHTSSSFSLVQTCRW